MWPKNSGPTLARRTCAPPSRNTISVNADSAASRPSRPASMDKPQTILVVDPETDFLEWIQHQLATPTTRVITASDSEEGFRLFCRERPDLLVVESHLAP